MAGASSSITSCLSSREQRFCRAAAFASAFLALTLAACGDDEEDAATDRPPTDTGATVTAPPGETSVTSTRTQTGARSTPTETEPASPEDQPGGAGDELPARSQAMFTGRDGRITPRIVLVPPFISVRVELRAADGRAYVLRAGRRTLSVDRDVGTASTTFDGLRPGRRIVLRGTGGRVIVEGSAEPGP